MKKRLFIYDFETNGLWHRGNQPIEVAIKVIEKNGAEINYHSYIKCNRPLSYTIEELTGITDAILEEKGKSIRTVFEEINKLLNKPDTLVIGHNIIRYDNLFLNRYMEEFGLPTITKHDCFDTAGQMKAELIGFQKEKEWSWGEYHNTAIGKIIKGAKYKLTDASKYYKVKQTEPLHNAKADVEHTYKILLKQFQKIKESKKNQNN